MRLNYFNFKSFDNKVLLTNDFGDHVFLEKDEFIFPEVPAWAIRIVLEKDNVTVF